MKKYYMYFVMTLFLSGCVGSLGNISATNPIEKGLSYVACAIVTHGLLQAFFNK